MTKQIDVVFNKLKKDLEDLKYKEPLGIESAPLAHHLLTDLLHLTKKYQETNEQRIKSEISLSEIQNQVAPLQKINNRLSNENKSLQNEMLKMEDNFSKDRATMQLKIRNLENEIKNHIFLLNENKKTLGNKDKLISDLKLEIAKSYGDRTHVIPLSNNKQIVNDNSSEPFKILNSYLKKNNISQANDRNIQMITKDNVDIVCHLTKERDNLNSILSSQSQEIDQLQTKLTDLSNKNIELSSPSTEKIKDEFNSTTLNQLNYNIKYLSDQLAEKDEAIKKMKDVEDENKELKQNIFILNRKKKELDDINTKLRADLRSLESLSRKIKPTLNTNLNTNSDKIKEFSGQIDELNRMNKMKDEEIANLQKEIGKYKVTIDSYNQREVLDNMEKLIQQVTQLREINEDKSQEITLLTDKIKQLNLSLQTFKSENELLQNKIQDLHSSKDAIKHLELEIEKLQSVNCQNVNEINKLTHENDSLRESIQTMNTSLVGRSKSLEIYQDSQDYMLESDDHRGHSDQIYSEVDRSLPPPPPPEDSDTTQSTIPGEYSTLSPLEQLNLHQKRYIEELEKEIENICNIKNKPQVKHTLSLFHTTLSVLPEELDVESFVSQYNTIHIKINESNKTVETNNTYGFYGDQNGDQSQLMIQKLQKSLALLDQERDNLQILLDEQTMNYHNLEQEYDRLKCEFDGLDNDRNKIFHSLDTYKIQFDEKEIYIKQLQSQIQQIEDSNKKLIDEVNYHKKLCSEYQSDIYTLLKENQKLSEEDRIIQVECEKFVQELQKSTQIIQQLENDKKALELDKEDIYITYKSLCNEKEQDKLLVDNLHQKIIDLDDINNKKDQIILEIKSALDTAIRDNNQIKILYQSNEERLNQMNMKCNQLNNKLMEFQSTENKYKSQINASSSLSNKYQNDLSQMDGSITQLNYEVAQYKHLLNEKSKEVERLQTHVTKLTEVNEGLKIAIANARSENALLHTQLSSLTK